MDHPNLSPVDDNTVSLHATGVSIGGAGLVITGPSGVGKSGLAAQLIALGADLITDDLSLVRRTDQGLVLTRPEGAPEAMELRGLGLASVPCRQSAPLRSVLILQSSPERMPDRETIEILGQPVELLRHPYRFDTASKVWIWLGMRRA